MKLGARGELVPIAGFSRIRTPLPDASTGWRSHDGLFVVSSCFDAPLPGSGEPPKIGPSWLVSVSRPAGPRTARCKATPADVVRVVASFAMPAFDEDNHHPGLARHLWCPMDPQYQDACECKLTEETITDGDYSWTTDLTAECRGCEYEAMFGLACPIHASIEGAKPAQEAS